MKHFNIKEAVETYGIKNIRVFGNGTEVSRSFPHMSTDLDMVEYALSESRYLMSENYKLTLEAVIKDSQLVDTIPPTHHYITDFNSLVNAGCYRVFIVNADDYTLISPPATIEVAEEQKFFDKLKALFSKFSPT
jgi:hypothetical protein